MGNADVLLGVDVLVMVPVQSLSSGLALWQVQPGVPLQAAACLPGGTQHGGGSLPCGGLQVVVVGVWLRISAEEPLKEQNPD